MPFVGLVGYPHQSQTKHKETLDKNQIIKWVVMKLTKHGKDADPHLISFWYVELYPEYRPHYCPFGFGYGIYIRVSILYTQKKGKYVSDVTPFGKAHGGA